jgi:hypothetical protein
MTSAPTTCRSCHAPIAWGESATGRRTPYDVVDGQPTNVSHFTTCPDARTWSRNGTASSAPAPVGLDRTTLRVRVLEIAAATIGQFAQAREEVRTEHVLPLADRLLTWVEQQP